MSRLAPLFSIAFFPLVLGGALLGAVGALAGGASLPVAVGVPTAVAVLVILGAERSFPHLRSWQRSHRDVAVDLAHAVPVAGTARLVQALAPIAFLPGAAWLGERVGGSLWPDHWPWLAQLPLALLVAELFQYWGHRMMHEWEPLWRLHATHHSAPRLYFLNAARFHPLDIGLDTLLGLLPLVLLGCPAEVQGLFALFTAVFGFLQHCNVAVRLGPLNYVFSMAELHRWHHAPDPALANPHDGSNLIVWDLAFGTFLWPRHLAPPEEIGIPDLPGFPTGYWAQLASPWRWRSIRAAGRAPTWEAPPA